MFAGIAGNTYSIKNLRDDNARLFYVVCWASGLSDNSDAPTWECTIPLNSVLPFLSFLLVLVMNLSQTGSLLPFVWRSDSNLITIAFIHWMKMDNVLAWIIKMDIRGTFHFHRTVLLYSSILWMKIYKSVFMVLLCVIWLKYWL